MTISLKPQPIFVGVSLFFFHYFYFSVLVCKLNFRNVDFFHFVFVVDAEQFNGVPWKMTFRFEMGSVLGRRG